MKLALSRGNKDVIESDYFLWLDFLKKIHPESELLKEYAPSTTEQKLSDSHNEIDPDFGKPIKQATDIREIMLLAEKQQYPTWFIQPKFTEETVVLEYEQGKQKTICERASIPKTIEGFTGKIIGQIHPTGFIAEDTNSSVNFLKKMELLETLHIKTPEFVLFPTSKIPTISSNKLEALLQTYTTEAQKEGLKVDGVVIVSDTPLFERDRENNRRRIALTTV